MLVSTPADKHIWQKTYLLHETTVYKHCFSWSALTLLSCVVTCVIFWQHAALAWCILRKRFDCRFSYNLIVTMVTDILHVFLQCSVLHLWVHVMCSLQMHGNLWCAEGVSYWIADFSFWKAHRKILTEASDLLSSVSITLVGKRSDDREDLWSL